jgi:hypothetical protein
MRMMAICGSTGGPKMFVVALLRWDRKLDLRPGKNRPQCAWIYRNESDGKRFSMRIGDVREPIEVADSLASRNGRM